MGHTQPHEHKQIMQSEHWQETPNSLKNRTLFLQCCFPLRFCGKATRGQQGWTIFSGPAYVNLSGPELVSFYSELFSMGKREWGRTRKIIFYLLFNDLCEIYLRLHTPMMSYGYTSPCFSKFSIMQDTWTSVVSHTLMEEPSKPWEI